MSTSPFLDGLRISRDSRDLDVVLLSADSLETIKSTHSSYFDTGEPFEALLPAALLRESIEAAN